VARPGPATVLGIDEAGRGAWVGPLVVGGVSVASSDLAALRATGARDSKLLSPAARERIYERLGRVASLRSVALEPTEIDRSVARGRLNDLEATAFGRLARELPADVTYVDACDVDARRFGRKVAAAAGRGTRVVSAHRADRDNPLVGAASIVAKVERDRAIARLSEALGGGLGSGYPSDRTTVEFVRRRVAADGPRPPWLRASWSTTERVIGGAPARALEEFAR
jgi:ribonuclease HII